MPDSTFPPADESDRIQPPPLDALPVEEPITAWLVDEDRTPAPLFVKPPHPGFWWSLLWCIIYLVVTQFPAALIALVIFFVRVTPEQLRQLDPNNMDALFRTPDFAMAMGVGVFAAQVLGILAGLIVVRVMVGAEWPRILALHLPSLPHLLLALVGLPGMIILASGIDLASRKYLPNLLELDEMMNMFSQLPVMFAVLAIGLGPGIAEELWCRGFLGRGLVGRYGVLGGVLLTSFLFAFLHLDPRQMLYTFPMGILLHLSYLATRSLWVPILLHTLNNSLAVLMLQLPPPWDTIDRTPEMIPWYIFPAAAVLLAGVGYALYESRARLVDLDPNQLYSWRSPFPGVEYPRPDDNVAVVRPWPSLLSWCIVAAAVGLFALSFWGLLRSVANT